MSQCYQLTTPNDCKILSYYLDITNTTELFFNIGKDAVMLILLAYFVWTMVKQKMWRRFENYQRNIIVVILSFMVSACFFNLIANSLEIMLFNELYFKAKQLKSINVLKNVYLSIVRIVSLLINNSYILLCVLWQKILINCNIWRGKNVFKYIGIVFFVYNAAVIAMQTLELVYKTNPQKQQYIKDTVWNPISYSLKALLTLPSILILVYSIRFVTKLSYINTKTTKNYKFRILIAILVIVNIFRILYEVLLRILPNSFEKLQQNQTTKCCQRQQKWFFAITITVISLILTFTPLITIFRIFIKKQEPKEQFKSLISQGSQISQQN